MCVSLALFSALSVLFSTTPHPCPPCLTLRRILRPALVGKQHPLLKTYGIYCANVHKAEEACKRLASNNQWRYFCQAAKKDKRCKGLGVDSFLMKPLQRITVSKEPMFRPCFTAFCFTAFSLRAACQGHNGAQRGAPFSLKPLSPPDPFMTTQKYPLLLRVSQHAAALGPLLGARAGCIPSARLYVHPQPPFSLPLSPRPPLPHSPSSLRLAAHSLAQTSLPQELQRATPEDHPDFEALQAAGQLYSSLVDTINEKKRDFEQVEQLPEIQRVLRGIPSVSTLRRPYIVPLGFLSPPPLSLLFACIFLSMSFLFCCSALIHSLPFFSWGCVMAAPPAAPSM